MPFLNHPAMGTGHVSMIREEDHDGILPKPAVIQGLEHLADPEIDQIVKVYIELVIGQGPGRCVFALELERQR